MSRLLKYLLLAVALSSCVKNVIVPAKTEPMVFSAFTSHSTKGIITTTNYPLDEPFVVQAVHYPQGFEASESSVLIDRQTVAYDAEDGLWKTGSQYVWPLNGGVRFFAGSPVVPEVQISAQNGVMADWTIETFDQTQTDLCFAEVDEKCNAHSAQIPIVFSHALSQVCFKARTLKHYSYSRVDNDLIQANIITVVLDSIKVVGIVSRGRFTQKPRKWDYDSGQTAEYLVFKSDEGQELKCDRYDSPILERLNNMLFIPQSIGSGAYIQEWHHMVVRTSVTNKTTGTIESDMTYTIPRSATIPLALYAREWETNYKYTYRIAVGFEETEVTMAFTDWMETREIIIGDE